MSTTTKEPTNREWQTITDLARALTKVALRRAERKASVAEIARQYNEEHSAALTPRDAHRLLTRARVFRITRARTAEEQIVTFDGFQPHSYERVREQMVQELTSRGPGSPRKTK